jgi:hypothetical protein
MMAARLGPTRFLPGSSEWQAWHLRNTCRPAAASPCAPPGWDAGAAACCAGAADCAGAVGAGVDVPSCPAAFCGDAAGCIAIPPCCIGASPCCMGSAADCADGGCAGAAGVLAAVSDGGSGGCGAAGLGAVDRDAAAVSLAGLCSPGGRDQSTANRAITAAIMMPGKKYRMSVPSCAADSKIIGAAKLAKHQAIIIDLGQASAMPHCVALFCSRRERPGAAVASAVLLC